jgi:hypothetical protein
MSIRVKIIATGEIKVVSNNEAFDLIDSHKAQVYHGEQLSQVSKPAEPRHSPYQDRQMRPLRK